jgi:uncharacterized membrane protein YoaK (UPF0700 family)
MTNPKHGVVVSIGDASLKRSIPALDLLLAPGLPFVLSVISGATDIIGFLGLNGLFTAHITGNLVLLAARIIAKDPTIIANILSVPVFMFVLLLTSLTGRAIEQRRGSSLRPLLLLQLLFLLAFLSIGVTAGPWQDPDATLATAAGMCGVAAMAVQNALVQIALKDTPTTAVMTTNVTHMMVDLSMMLIGDGTESAKAKIRALQILPVVVGFVMGCGLGAASEATAGLWALVVPTALASFAAAWQWPGHRAGQAR